MPCLPSIPVKHADSLFSFLRMALPELVRWSELLPFAPIPVEVPLTLDDPPAPNSFSECFKTIMTIVAIGKVEITWEYGQLTEGIGNSVKDGTALTRTKGAALSKGLPKAAYLGLSHWRSEQIVNWNINFPCKFAIALWWTIVFWHYPSSRS